MDNLSSRTKQKTLKLIKSCSEEIVPDLQFMDDWFHNYCQAHYDRIAYDYDLLRDHYPVDSKIVEIGPTPYLLTLPLMKTGYVVTGIDIEPDRFKTTISKFKLDIRKCDIEREPLPLSDNFCDVILFNEIFEHLRIDLIFTMQELFRILKPNGCLFLSTPNVRSWVGIKNFFFKKKVQSCSTDIFLEYSKLKTLGHMGHVREYTSAEIKVFLRKMGFVIEETIYRGSYETFPGNCIIRFNPRLRPFFTCIARKPFE